VTQKQNDFLKEFGRDPFDNCVIQRLALVAKQASVKKHDGQFVDLEIKPIRPQPERIAIAFCFLALRWRFRHSACARRRDAGGTCHCETIVAHEERGPPHSGEPRNIAIRLRPAARRRVSLPR
jgi:hypothetical protein